ncbi:MAG: DUF6600 domain-containing protein, partial [Kiritimatiellia bacterium]
MKASLILASALLAAQGCLPERQPPAAPPAVAPAPAAPAASAASAPSSDERALQTLRDLGVTPEVMLQLVRNQLATAARPDTPGQPVPASIEEAIPSAAPVPIQQAPAPAIPDQVPTAQVTEPPAVSEPPPATDWPNAPALEQPATRSTVNTVVLEQPVVIQQTQDFYTPLNSYGDWITVPAYGRVWQPAVTIVNAEWRPYCNGGRWVYTDCGWYWQSDYSWGWAVFHYGRWCYVDRHRWVWIPDTVWAPAWVSWRRTETHCGWAPLPPGTTFRAGVGFTIGQGARFDVQFGLSSRHYTFVAHNRMGEQNLNRVIIRKEEAETVYQRSSHVDDSYNWDKKQRRVNNKGPDRDEDARARQPSARTIRLVTPPAAPVTRPTPPAAPIMKPPASIAPAAPTRPVVTPATPDTPATPATPATPSEPPHTKPDKHTPKSTPSPTVPMKWQRPETPKNEPRTPPAAEHEPAADAPPVTLSEPKAEPVKVRPTKPETRLPDTRHRDSPSIALPRGEPPPSIPAAEPIPKPSTPITTQPVRRDTPTSEPVTLSEPKAEPVKVRPAKPETRLPDTHHRDSPSITLPRG